MNKWIITGGVFGFLGVAIGAFGAHSLKQFLTTETIETYRTGVQYQLIHAVVILAIGYAANERYNLAAWFFTAGIILFSFSLYAYSLTGMRSLAIITPFGGVCFLAGWLMVVVAAFRSDKPDKP